MSDTVVMKISLPLDDGFLRRECPFCYREFKVLLQEEELTDYIQRGIDSFMIESSEEDVELEPNESSGSEFSCPYCGQRATEDGWWTQQQLAYFKVIATNIIAKQINEHLIRPLKRMARRSSSGPVSMRFEGKEIKQQEPWISPETSDMKIFDLPCCGRKMKIADDWEGVVYCFFCGFPHEFGESSSKGA